MVQSGNRIQSSMLNLTTLHLCLQLMMQQVANCNQLKKSLNHDNGQAYLSIIHKIIRMHEVRQINAWVSRKRLQILSKIFLKIAKMHEVSQLNAWFQAKFFLECSISNEKKKIVCSNFASMDYLLLHYFQYEYRIHT